MRHIGWSVIVSGVCLAAVGCADKSQQSVNTSPPGVNTGNALAASGFKIVPANTPERQAAIRQLPPQTFVRQMRGDKVVFVYADPANCNCLYAGGLTAYSTYRARANRQIADEQAMTAMDNWDWSPWTFGYP